MEVSCLCQSCFLRKVSVQKVHAYGVAVIKRERLWVRFLRRGRAQPRISRPTEVFECAEEAEAADPILDDPPLLPDDELTDL